MIITSNTHPIWDALTVTDSYSCFFNGFTLYLNKDESVMAFPFLKKKKKNHFIASKQKTSEDYLVK